MRGRARLVALAICATLLLSSCSTVVPRRPGEAENLYGSVPVELRQAVDTAVGPLIWEDAGRSATPVRDDGRCLLVIGSQTAALGAPLTDATEVSELLGAVNGVLSRHHFASQKAFAVGSSGGLSLESEDAHGAEVYVKADTQVTISLKVPARPGECHT